MNGWKATRKAMPLEDLRRIVDMQIDELTKHGIVVLERWDKSRRIVVRYDLLDQASELYIREFYEIGGTICRRA